ncbi:MAG: cytochrome c [Gammaproteobacteria bacterium]|nr:MAG: cytochrome c [Gammaproteobacteria bacterium]
MKVPILSTVFYVALLASSSAANALTAERAQVLIDTLRQDCGSCHGMTLKGGLGPALTPEALRDKPLEFITRTILDGRPNTAMPPWRPLLTNEEAEWLARQLKEGVK